MYFLLVIHCRVICISSVRIMLQMNVGLLMSKRVVFYIKNKFVNHVAPTIYSSLGRKCIVNEKTFASWQSFYHDTNAAMRGFETCDCFREVTSVVEELVENRYLFIAEYNLTVTYLSLFGLVPMKALRTPGYVDSNVLFIFIIYYLVSSLFL